MATTIKRSDDECHKVNANIITVAHTKRTACPCSVILQGMAAVRLPPACARNAPLAVPLWFGDNLSLLHVRDLSDIVHASLTSELPEGVRWSLSVAAPIAPGAPKTGRKEERAKEVYLVLYNWEVLRHDAERALERTSVKSGTTNCAGDDQCCLRPVPISCRPVEWWKVVDVGNDGTCCSSDETTDSDDDIEADDAVPPPPCSHRRGGGGDAAAAEATEYFENCQIYVPSPPDVKSAILSSLAAAAAAAQSGEEEDDDYDKKNVNEEQHRQNPDQQRKICDALRVPPATAIINVCLKVRCRKRFTQHGTTDVIYTYRPTRWTLAVATNENIDALGRLPSRSVANVLEHTPLWLGKLEKGTTLSVEHGSLVRAPALFNSSEDVLYARAYVHDGHFGAHYVYVPIGVFVATLSAVGGDVLLPLLKYRAPSH